MKKETFQKSIRKIIASGMVCCCLTAGLGGFAYAAEIPDPADDNGPVARLEETKWYYRDYNGRVQKRIWSITRGIWLTEWEYV